MRILFATNLTEPRSVTSEVEQLARLTRADLYVLHVIAPVPGTAVAPIDPMTGMSGFAPYTFYDPELESNIEQAEENAFQTFLKERFSIPVHAGISRGDAADVILADADDHDVDLIALSKRRHGRLERLLVGSTVQSVLKHASRPVLVLPVGDDENG